MLSFSKYFYTHWEGDKDYMHTVKLQVELNGPLGIKTIV